MSPGFAGVRAGGPGPTSRPVPGPISPAGSIHLDNIRPDNIRRAVSAWARADPAYSGANWPLGSWVRHGQPESRGKRSDSKAQLLTTTAGILRRAASNQLVIEPDDHRVVWYRLAPQLKVLKDGKDADLKDFALGDYLSVDSNSDDDSVMTAVSVTWKKAGTPEDRAEASKTWDLPRPETAARGAAKSAPASDSNSSALSPPREPGDERPVLRRKDPEPAPAPRKRNRKPNLFPTSRKKLRQRSSSGSASSEGRRTGQHSAADPNAPARSEAGCGRSRPAGSEARRARSQTPDHRRRTRSHGLGRAAAGQTFSSAARAGCTRRGIATHPARRRSHHHQSSRGGLLVLRNAAQLSGPADDDPVSERSSQGELAGTGCRQRRPDVSGRPRKLQEHQSRQQERQQVHG